MQHPFAVLAPEYIRLLAACQITKRFEAQVAAKRILGLKARYAEVAAKTHVPALWLMVINERKVQLQHATYLGNGEPLYRPTRLVPRGRGPFTGPDAWEAGAEDALHLDRIDAVSDWSWPKALYEEELWNGFGPRARGYHTGYLWAGTSVYEGGKYVADGVWNPNAWDQQLGCVPLMRELVRIDPSLDLPQPVPPPSPLEVPAIHDTPAVSPVGVDGGIHGVAWLQTALNTLQNAELVVDGSYGRRTTAAVRGFQVARGPDADRPRRTLDHGGARQGVRGASLIFQPPTKGDA